MIFSNLIVYKFKGLEDCKYDFESFENALTQDVSKPCQDQQLSTFGWTKALGKYGETLSHFSQDCILICAKRIEKVLPAQVINEMVSEKVDIIEAEESRRVRKKEKDEIKENIIHTVLPSAFTKSSLQFAFINMTKGLIVVNSPSFNKAEELLALLRKSLGSLPVVPVFQNIDVSINLKSWVQGFGVPAHFQIGHNAEIAEPLDTDSTAKFKGYDLKSDDFKTHLENGMFVTSLELIYKENVTFTVKDDGSIKSVKFSDVLKEENSDISSEDMAVKLDADFVLFSYELSELVDYTSFHLSFVDDEPESNGA